MFFTLWPMPAKVLVLLGSERYSGWPEIFRKECNPMQPVFKPDQIPAYSNKPMPAYRHIPFKTPYPEIEDGSHCYTESSTTLAAFSAQSWQDCELYLYCIDLFNQGYWWEAHELLKQVCLAVGRESVIGRFLEAVIQISAGELKHYMQEEKGAQVLLERGLAGLLVEPPIFLGIEIAAFAADIKECLAAENQVFPRIILNF